MFVKQWYQRRVRESVMNLNIVSRNSPAVSMEYVPGKKPVKRACKTCAISHSACSESRPCTRCTKRGILCEEQDSVNKHKGSVGYSKCKEPAYDLNSWKTIFPDAYDSDTYLLPNMASQTQDKVGIKRKYENGFSFDSPNPSVFTSFEDSSSGSLNFPQPFHQDHTSHHQPWTNQEKPQERPYTSSHPRPQQESSRHQIPDHNFSDRIPKRKLPHFQQPSLQSQLHPYLDIQHESCSSAYHTHKYLHQHRNHNNLHNHQHDFSSVDQLQHLQTHHLHQHNLQQDIYHHDQKCHNHNHNRCSCGHVSTFQNNHLVQHNQLNRQNDPAQKRQHIETTDNQDCFIKRDMRYTKEDPIHHKYPPHPSQSLQTTDEQDHLPKRDTRCTKEHPIHEKYLPHPSQVPQQPSQIWATQTCSFQNLYQEDSHECSQQLLIQNSLQFNQISCQASQTEQKSNYHVQTRLTQKPEQVEFNNPQDEQLPSFGELLSNIKPR
eukprot:TRINITY_DN934_c0_g1_i2.p1 TRINITY_DN934_c0_g1~~TRINITY_DN934_c0_g1_i2.p1  ORF type:complete len:489 (-),score=66.87 TRINITY_DN934_c0_g1_i2:334-1800(-)